MGSISLLTTHHASRSDLVDNSRPSLLSNRTVSANFSQEQRLCANASQNYYEYMQKIPKMIAGFIVDRYADARMFIRAFSSMFGQTTSVQIDSRITEVRRFRVLMDNSEVRGQRASQYFEQLTPETKALFFYTNANYLTYFANETDPAKAADARYQILRECTQVISFQHSLTVVNTFYRAFVGRGASSATEPSEDRPAPSFWDRLGRIFHRDRGEPEPVSEPIRERPMTGVDLNVPNTVPYLQNAIPAAIQTKADEINRLLATYTGPVPPEFLDLAMRDFMIIPVFDASHTMVQAHLPTLRGAIAGGVGVAEAIAHQRTLRHAMDVESLETHIAGGTSWAPAKCMVCRHPEHGGIRREALMIDTGLQDDILNFLRTAAARP